VNWGEGLISTLGLVKGGILMASNVHDSTRVWKSTIKKPAKCFSTDSKFGNIEHMRFELNEGIKLKANEVWWMSDTSPHESLPMKQDTYRQFVRIVLGMKDKEKKGEERRKEKKGEERRRKEKKGEESEMYQFGDDSTADKIEEDL
jgi:hypothetical protein